MIYDRYTPIEGVEQLREQFQKHPGFYLLHDLAGRTLKAVTMDAPFNRISILLDGLWNNVQYNELVGYCTSFRHVHDTAPTGNTSGFEKKTVIAGSYLQKMAGEYGEENFMEAAHECAKEVLRAYAEIDRQAALLASEREWVPIVSAEQLDAEPDGTYEVYCEHGNKKLLVAVKDGSQWRTLYSGGYLDSKRMKINYSYYRLITRQSDFTPPERRIATPEPSYAVSDLKAMWEGASK